MKGQDIMIYVGIDAASTKHDYFIQRDTGEVFSKKAITIKNDINEGAKIIIIFSNYLLSLFFG